MYDLKPVRLSARSRYVRFTDEIEQEFSPQRHIDRSHDAGSAGVRAARRRRSSSVRHATSPLPCAPRFWTVEVLIGQHYNHFEIVETLGSPYGGARRAALAQIGAGR